VRYGAFNKIFWTLIIGPIWLSYHKLVDAFGATTKAVNVPKVDGLMGILLKVLLILIRRRVVNVFSQQLFEFFVEVNKLLRLIHVL
jgi:hypothetical protein